MGGFFGFDRDTGLGIFVSDEEIKDVAGVVSIAVGAYALYALLLLLVGAVIVSPFVTLFALDYFVDTFVKSNALFFISFGILLTVVRLFWGRISQSIIVRSLFCAYFAATVLYFLLDILHFDVAIYTFFGIIGEYFPDSAFSQLISSEKLLTHTDGNWFYALFFAAVDSLIGFVKWGISQLLKIDHSCFTAALTEINILLVLRTLVLDILIGGFALAVTLLWGLLLLAVLLIAIVLPYLASYYAVIFINKAVYHFRSRQTRKPLKPDEACRTEDTLQAALRKSSIPGPAAQKEAAALFLQSAKAGNPFAQYLYANCLDSDKGVIPDIKEAFKWYHRAAVQGIADAKFMTAYYYFEGQGTCKDPTLARAWLIAALQDSKFLKMVKSTPQLRTTATNILKKTRFVQYV